MFTEEAVRNFQNGTHYSLYEYFGNKQIEVLENKIIVKSSKPFEAFVKAVKEPFKTLVGLDLEFIEEDKKQEELYGEEPDRDDDEA